jgi:hypothetical protein
MTDPAPELRARIEDAFNAGQPIETIVGQVAERCTVLDVLRLNGWDLDGSGRLPRSKRTTVPRGLRGLPPAPVKPSTTTTSRHRTPVPDLLDGHPLPTEPPTPTAAAAEQAALDVPIGDPPERWLPPLDDPRLPEMAGSITVSGDTIARATEIRERVDAMAPRANESGGVNTQHVAMEQTLRERAGLPSYIPELDGPGNFLPDPPDPEPIPTPATPPPVNTERPQRPRRRPPVPLAIRGRRPDGRDLDDWLDEASRSPCRAVAVAALRAHNRAIDLHDALDELVRAEHRYAGEDR